MSHYRRADFPGGYYFFTVITHNRAKIFTNELARESLRMAIEKVKTNHPFEITAMCLLPEHLHCIWKLPIDDCDFSTRWSLIKKNFSRDYLSKGGKETIQTASRVKHRSWGIWQRRFWEHQIRDVKDLENHVSYIHYNPLKHGLVGRLEDWPWSTFHRYYETFNLLELEKSQNNVNIVKGYE